MKVLAVIPARSGSKGLPDKNIRLFNGKPLIAYTIEAALKSFLFDEVMVSTDSSYYASLAEHYGAKVPFLRSRENSSDQAGSWAVVKEVVKWYERQGRLFDVVCLLQPTSPLRTSEDIKAACALYRERGACAVVSVCEADHPPAWYHTLPEDGCLEGFIRREDNMQRQKAGKYYRVNGAIYLADINMMKEEPVNLYQKGCFAYKMAREKSMDIDTEMDFLYAEWMAKIVAGGGISLKRNKRFLMTPMDSMTGKAFLIGRCA